MSRQNNVFYQRPQQNSSSPTSDKATTYSSPKTFTVKAPASGGIKDWIANAIIVLLSISFVIFALVAVAEVADRNYSWERDENEFWRYIADGNYSDIVQYVYHNENEGVKPTPGLEQCYAVANYFQAASLYKVAVNVGDTEDMEKYSAMMEECLTYMDDIEYVVEDIHLQLGME